MFQPGSGNEAFRASISPSGVGPRAIYRPCQSIEQLTVTTSWSRSTLLHQCSGALADFLKRHFECAKLLWA
jgi:hypothetical protein